MWTGSNPKVIRGSLGRVIDKLYYIAFHLVISRERY